MIETISAVVTQPLFDQTKLPENQWLTLPTEIFLKIFSDGQLEFPDLFNASLTCHHWFALVSDESIKKAFFKRRKRVFPKLSENWVIAFRKWIHFQHIHILMDNSELMRDGSDSGISYLEEMRESVRGFARNQFSLSKSAIHFYVFATENSCSYELAKDMLDVHNFLGRSRNFPCQNGGIGNVVNDMFQVISEIDLSRRFDFRGDHCIQIYCHFNSELVLKPLIREKLENNHSLNPELNGRVFWICY